MQATELAQLPQASEHYHVCSDRYGDHLLVPHSRYVNDFYDAVDDAYRDGTLYDQGHLVIDKASDQLAFLITVRIDSADEISPENLTCIADQYGLVARILIMPAAGSCDPAYRFVSIQLDRVEQFDHAWTISSLIHALIKN